MKWFPPFFPHSRFLDKQPWHKVIWFLSAVFSACSVYSAVIVFLLSLNIRVLTPGALSWLMVLPSAPLLWVFQHDPASLNLDGNSPVVAFYWHNPGLATALRNPNSGLWLLAVYYLVLIFVPSVFYRLILNQLFGKRWRVK